MIWLAYGACALMGIGSGLFGVWFNIKIREWIK